MAIPYKGWLLLSNIEDSCFQCLSYRQTVMLVHRSSCMELRMQDTRRIPAGHTVQRYKSHRSLDGHRAASTINGQTMQIGLWISLYGFQSRTARSANWQCDGACTMRAGLVSPPARSRTKNKLHWGRCGLCVVDRRAARCLSPSIYTTASPPCFCPSSSTGHVTTYVTIGTQSLKSYR